MTLAACSTPKKPTTNHPICPQSNQCQTPIVNIKTNGDLVTTLTDTLNTIEICKIEKQALIDCIENKDGSN
ncbi:Rz1-like lysis system protein LysC [Gallibacterium genomosp. 3]|uniref:Rz1-like lysis system protein LysC n=1 Tax=Gallibacterium genomosp. 3 TaxID=505345 RepID=UPI0012E809F4|nr:Rz1-like lysis system protein LysC [Gallibacterium genomosp. 3]